MQLRSFNTKVLSLLLFFTFTILGSISAQDNYVIEKPNVQGDNYSGDKQHQKTHRQKHQSRPQIRLLENQQHR